MLLAAPSEPHLFLQLIKPSFPYYLLCISHYFRFNFHRIKRIRGTGCHIETSGLHKPHFESNIVKVVNDLGECISEETVPQAEGKVNTKPLRWDVVWGNVAGANQWEGA